MSTLNSAIINSAMSELVAEQDRIHAQIEALKTLSSFEPHHKPSHDAGGFIGRIKEVLVAHPGATSTEVRESIMASGYKRPRAGGPIKRHEVPIALGRLTKAGEVVRIGGSKVEGFHYAVA